MNSGNLNFWSFSAGNRVMMSFQQFDLTRSEHCNVDYVEIRKGDAMGELMAHACGNSMPNNMTAAESIWIRFRSGNLSVAPGFVAHYELSKKQTIVLILNRRQNVFFPLSAAGCSAWKRSHWCFWRNYLARLPSYLHWK